MAIADVLEGFVEGFFSYANYSRPRLRRDLGAAAAP